MPAFLPASRPFRSLAAVCHALGFEEARQPETTTIPVLSPMTGRGFGRPGTRICRFVFATGNKKGGISVN